MIVYISVFTIKYNNIYMNTNNLNLNTNSNFNYYVSKYFENYSGLEIQSIKLKMYVIFQKSKNLEKL